MAAPSEIHTVANTPLEVGELPRIIPVQQDLSLAQFTPKDGSAIYALLERNPDFYNYLAWATKVKSEADVIPSIQAYSNRNMDGRYGIVSPDGIRGYTGIHKSESDYALSYGLDHAARGHGYVNLALRVLIRMAYVELHARSFVMQIQPENAASVHVAESLGSVAAEKVMGVDFPVMQQRWRLDGAALEKIVS